MFCQHVCSLGIEPTTFALLTQCSNHWTTGTHNHKRKHLWKPNVIDICETEPMEDFVKSKPIRKRSRVVSQAHPKLTAVMSRLAWFWPSAVPHSSSSSGSVRNYPGSWKLMAKFKCHKYSAAKQNAEERHVSILSGGNETRERNAVRSRRTPSSACARDHSNAGSAQQLQSCDSSWPLYCRQIRGAKYYIHVYPCMCFIKMTLVVAL